MKNGLSIAVMILIPVLFMAGCGDVSLRQVESGARQRSSNRYAAGFSIEYSGELRILSVFDPWLGADGVTVKYILRPAGAEVPDSLGNLPVFDVPVRSVACFSTTHAGLLAALGREGSLVGFSGPRLLCGPAFRERAEKGLIADLGYEQGLNYEALLALKPDLVMTYGVSGEVNRDLRRLTELGLPVVINADYLEASPLGKAEWIRFMAAFFLLDSLADSIFSNIEKRYLELCEQVRGVKDRPAVMTGFPWKDSWYVPGGRSFAARFIHDAGGSYLFGEDTGRVSIPCSIESVFTRAAGADIWLNPGAAVRLDDILRAEPRLAGITAVRQGWVYNNNAVTNAAGASDYWESGIVNPHLILEDLIRIFHPGTLPGDVLHYYRKLDGGK